MKKISRVLSTGKIKFQMKGSLKLYQPNKGLIHCDKKGFNCISIKQR